MSVEKDISKFMNQLAVDLNKNAASRKQGNFPFRVELNGMSAKLYGFKWLIQAWETGRGKTVNNGDGSLRRNLEKWVKKKGIASGKEVKGIAYAIAKTIHERGTRLHRGDDPRFTKPTGTISDVINDGRINTLLNSIGVSIKKNIVDEIRV